MIDLYGPDEVTVELMKKLVKNVRGPWWTGRYLLLFLQESYARGGREQVCLRLPDLNGDVVGLCCLACVSVGVLEPVSTHTFSSLYLRICSRARMNRSLNSLP